MPHSLVLNLLPRSQKSFAKEAPITPEYLTGRHLHALFLTLVSSVDKPLGDRLHEQKTDKAFTLSPLQSQKRVGKAELQVEHRQAIAPGTPCWWRISLLDDSLFGHLTKLWLNLNPESSWHLGAADLQIVSVLGTPQPSQPWANFMSYGQLYEQASETERQIELLLCTPTAFRQGQFDSAMPTRDAVFGSLLRRWNQYSGMEFPESLIEAVFPSSFEIRTEMVRDSRSKFIGCVGSIAFRILGEVDPVIIKQINALADFAMYSGVGRKTPMGMGMLRRVKHER
jgi:CRISPR-associated endoribonuclease Cas6